MVRASYMCYF